MRIVLVLLAWTLVGCWPKGSHETASAAVKVEPESFEDYSFANGVNALVEAKQKWRTVRKCVSCHTNGWGLVAQPIIAPESEEVSVGRSFAQEYLKKYLDGKVKPSRQHGSTEGMVATTAFLAMSDARSGKGLNAVTRQGLDHAWRLLDESGTWDDWLQCNWPPFESDAEFGPTLMLVALGELSQVTQIESNDRANAKKLGAYLRANPPLSLHAKAMRLWASKYWPDLMGLEEVITWRDELMDAQQADGGWSMASLSGPAWKRDGGEVQTMTSEAYPTAFATYVLLRAEREHLDGKSWKSNREPVSKGLSWLKDNQLESGEWFTRSPRRDGKHYISRAATAFALMALTEGRGQ
jgi:squalene-hopene/tetraprenyl-beta-curcumene cyclase